MRHLARPVLKEESHSWIYIFAPGLSRTLFPGLFSRHCFFFVMWALRTQCVNYEEPPLCPHALRQNRCVRVCVCVCVAVCCCCVWGGQSLRNPELLVPPGFFFFFSWAFLSRFPRWLCVSVWGRRLHVCIVWMCMFAKKKKKKKRHLSYGGAGEVASVDPPPVRYLREQLFSRKTAHVCRSTPTTCAYFRYKQIV